jgi:hypothetical protein
MKRCYYRAAGFFKDLIFAIASLKEGYHVIEIV